MNFSNWESVETSIEDDQPLFWALMVPLDSDTGSIDLDRFSMQQGEAE